MPRMKGELPRWEALPDKDRTGRTPCQAARDALRVRQVALLPVAPEQDIRQPTQVRAAQLGHAWTLPFQNRCQLPGFCGRLAILMFTDHAHRDWSPKGAEQDSGSPL